MSTESVQPDLEPRTFRAVLEDFECTEIARALFEVTSESGSVYTVDLREPVCQCPDFQYREHVEECKHIRRVRIEVGQVDVEALEQEIASTVSELEEIEERLETKAREISDGVAEMNDVVHRIQEVA